MVDAMKHNASEPTGVRTAAALDIGTHSALLLVAAVHGRARVEVLTHAEQVTRLGQGLARTGALGRAAIRETVEACAGLAAKAREMGAERLAAAATSAARDAANSDELLAALASAGIEARILSGDDEARLGFAGVCTDERLSSGGLLTVEVGGGSSQVCWGACGRLEFARSLDLGAMRLNDRWLSVDPPDPSEMERLRRDAEAGFAGVPAPPLGCRAVALGGAAMTLAAVRLARGGPLPADPAAYFRLLDGAELTAAEIEAVLADMASRDQAGRAAVPGMPRERERVIVPGAAILLAAMRRFGLSAVTVSLRGLRFGLVVGAA